MKRGFLFDVFDWGKWRSFQVNKPGEPEQMRKRREQENRNKWLNQLRRCCQGPPWVPATEVEQVTHALQEVAVCNL